MPYFVKHKVWSAALNTAIFYGSEMWWCSNLRDVNKVHIETLSDLLGIRKTIFSNLIYIESGELSASAFIERKQLKFLIKLCSRPDYDDSYLQLTINKAIDARSPMGIYIEQLGQSEQDTVLLECQALRDRVNANIESSRRLMYKQLNPDLESPTLYKSRHISIPEHHRIAFTRLRLGSHRLKIETGRWSRIPRERRLCLCGEVQDELHVLVRRPKK